MTNKKERLFVIMEVKQYGHGVSEMKGRSRCCPIDASIMDENMWLKPSRIIPEGRLRYGVPQKGETYFARHNVGREEYEIRGWEEAEINKGFTALILDPEPEAEKDEWEEWADDAPSCIDDRTKNWLKRMPKRG